LIPFTKLISLTVIQFSGTHCTSFAQLHFKKAIYIIKIKNLLKIISFSFFIILESTEDEDAEELTEDVEKDFFRTLSMLKSKDPRIYDGKTTFFATGPKDDNGDVDVDGVVKKKEKKEKPLTLGDLERKVMLEKGGHYEEMDEFKPTPRLDLSWIKIGLESDLSWIKIGLNLDKN
jgi:hypothetical protein